MHTLKVASGAIARSLLLAILIVPGVASAVTINIAVDGFMDSGIGVCNGPDINPTGDPGGPPPNSNGDCWYLSHFPIYFGTPADGPFNGLPADWLLAAPVPTSTVDLTNPVTLSQDFNFAANDTGGGSAGPNPFSLLDPSDPNYRSPSDITPFACNDPSIPSNGVTSPYSVTRNVIVNSVAMGLTQTGTFTVGWCFDTISLGDGFATFNYSDIGLPGQGTVTVKISGFTQTAFADPLFTAPLTIDALDDPVPLPSTLALFGIGLAGFAGRRRRRS